MMTANPAPVITRFCALLLIGLTIVLPIAAQEDAPESTPPAEATPEAAPEATPNGTPDAPAIMTTTLTLTADAPAQMTYSAQANEAVSIGVRGGGTIDTTLSVFAPDGERIAFNDDLQIPDGSGDGCYEWGDTCYSANESLLPYLVFPVAGDYTIVIDSFNGVQEGEVTVSIEGWRDGFFVLIEDTPQRTVVNFPLRPHDPIGTYTFSVQAGERLTISARDVDGGLDPRLMLLDPAGTVIAANDDHAGEDSALDTLDAQIAAFVIPADGDYTVLVSDFLGHDGVIELTIQR